MLKRLRYVKHHDIHLVGMFAPRSGSLVYNAIPSRFQVEGIHRSAARFAEEVYRGIHSGMTAHFDWGIAIDAVLPDFEPFLVTIPAGGNRGDIRSFAVLAHDFSLLVLKEGDNGVEISAPV